MMKIACPCCGEAFSPDQLSELRQEMSEYAPGDVGEPAGEGAEYMEMGPTAAAMKRELQNPKNMAERKE